MNQLKCEVMISRFFFSRIITVRKKLIVIFFNLKRMDESEMFGNGIQNTYIYDLPGRIDQFLKINLGICYFFLKNFMTVKFYYYTLYWTKNLN